MKNILKAFLGLFVMLVLFTNCTKQEESIRICNKTNLDRLNKNWKLTNVQWSASDPRPLNDDCLDVNCIHFNLNLQDSLYSFSYLVTRELDNNVIDTFRLQEQGIFHYEYCHRTNMNANGGHYPGGFTNNGTIEFFPETGEPYTSLFKSDIPYPLEMGFKFGEYRAVVNFE